MLERIAVAGFATAGALFAAVGLLPAFRGEGVNVVFFVLGIVFLILAMTVGSALARKQKP